MFYVFTALLMQGVDADEIYIFISTINGRPLFGNAVTGESEGIHSMPLTIPVPPTPGIFSNDYFRPSESLSKLVRSVRTTVKICGTPHLPPRIT